MKGFRVLSWAIAAIAIGFGSVPSAAVGATISDNFDTTHDYLTDGVAGTIWDGTLTAMSGTSISKTIANDGGNGVLSMASSYTKWSAANTGFFLYKEVTGDFTAEVFVSGASIGAYNDLGLMARSADTSAGEDWIGGRYFAYTGQIAMRSTNNAVSTDTARDANNQAIDLHDGTFLPLYILLERSGDDFTFSYKVNETDAYTLFNTVTRTDLGETLQVGIWQQSGGTGSHTAQFDNFNLTANFVPEPGSLVLATLGFAGVVVLARRRRRQ